MKVLKWFDFSDNYDGFNFSFKIPITNENFKEKILLFDEVFLRNSSLYRLFYFQSDTFIEQYLNQRRNNFLKSDRKWLMLLDLEQFVSLAGLQLYGTLPDSRKGSIEVAFQQPFVGLRFLEFDNSSSLNYLDILDLSFWYEELDLSIISHSNIWWETILYSQDEAGYLKALNEPVNNKFSAYRITPRFNSFLREIKKKVKEFGGSFQLGEHNKDFVTSDGILLDGRIIYQEDIDEGRVKLPAI